MISRRSLFRGLASLLAAPPIAKVASLIPAIEARRVRSLNYIGAQQVTREAMRLFLNTNYFISDIQSNLPRIGKVGTQLRIRMPTDYKNT